MVNTFGSVSFSGHNALFDTNAFPYSFLPVEIPLPGSAGSEISHVFCVFALRSPRDNTPGPRHAQSLCLERVLGSKPWPRSCACLSGASELEAVFHWHIVDSQSIPLVMPNYMELPHKVCTAVPDNATNTPQYIAHIVQVSYACYAFSSFLSSWTPTTFHLRFTVSNPPVGQVHFTLPAILISHGLSERCRRAVPLNSVQHWRRREQSAVLKGRRAGPAVSISKCSRKPSIRFTRAPHGTLRRLGDGQSRWDLEASSDASKYVHP